MPGGSGSSSRTGVRVVVVGDRGTGKSSLIAAAATESVPEKVPPVHAPTRLPPDFYPDRVPVTIIDTSSRYANTSHLYPYTFILVVLRVSELSLYMRKIRNLRTGTVLVFYIIWRFCF